MQEKQIYVPSELKKKQMNGLIMRIRLFGSRMKKMRWRQSPLQIKLKLLQKKR